MELKYFKYESVYPNSKNSKNDQSYSGLLLKLTDSEGNSGYTNYHSLHGFADVSAQEFLDGFASENLEGRHKLHMQYLKQDLQNRVQKTDALAGAFQLENHKLISNCLSLNENDLTSIVKNNFKYIKIKLGNNLPEESLWIDSHKALLKENKTKLRLDFNEVLTVSEFEDWLLKWDLHKEGIIDFYEDPCIYEEAAWSRWKNQGVRLAKDFVDDNLQFTKGISVFTLKPALTNIVEWLKKLDTPSDYEYVVTHYMDSPLGVAQAVASALKLKFFVKDRLITCGLLPVDQFTGGLDWPLKTSGPHLLFQDDVGLGFTKELENIHWQSFRN